MTDTLKSMRNRGDFRGRKRICSHSLNLKKYEIVNYFSSYIVILNIEALFHKETISYFKFAYAIDWATRRLAAQLAQDTYIRNLAIELKRSLEEWKNK